MSLFKDFIPADDTTPSAVGNGKFKDFVPTEEPAEVVAEVTPEVAPEAPKTLMDYTKPELVAMAAELGITDKKILRTKETIAAAIEAKRAEVAPVEETPAPEVAPEETPEVAPVASLADAPIEDETSIVQ